ncbi:MAG TPA: FUN14 domain-containing protein, partial [Thermodesulfobacteriota bacterium]
SSATPIAVGGIAGFLAGYAIKKVIKIFLIIAGLMIVAFVGLGYQQYVSVDWSKIQEAGSGLLGNVSNSNIPGTEQSISSVMAAFGIPLVGSLAAGFILGFIKG